jgi:toxin-antitoxin system PIN domain toxin
VILPDVNLLIYAYNSDSPKHSEARAWWEQTLSGSRQVGMAWVAILGFIRVSTHPRVFSNPMPPAEAMSRVKSWLDHPSVRVVTPGEHHGRILFKLLEDLGTAGNLTTDAHLAALAIEYKAELASTDVDFARFEGLRWFNPLAAGARAKTSKGT